MTVRKYSSRAQQTTLASPITDSSSSMTVVSGGGAKLMGGKTLTGSETYTVVIDPDTNLEEIVDITVYSSGDTLTITRARDGSSAVGHSAGAVVRHMVIGRDLQEANTHIEVSSGVHGLTGTVVGTTDSQTLSNKTLTSPIINNPTVTGAGVDASIVFEGATADAHETTLTVQEPTQDNVITLPNTTGTVVIANAAQTLTNKTIDMTGVTLTGLSSAGMVASSATPKDYVDSILGSATAAATSAASAATSAASAATSASSALTSANSASASATAAATSASSASTSASSALTSANSASTSATSAANSESAAATSASSASTSASSALTSANSAATSATSAATSASSASTSASSALTSANSAASSATAAAGSATAAAGSAAAAETAAAGITTYASLPVEYRQYGAEGSVLNNLPTRVDSAELLLKQAAYWIDSAHSSAAGQTVTNLGYVGSVLPTTVGSSTSADSNDPKYLAWDGTNYVYLSGTSSNALIVPDSAALDTTGDLDLRVQLAMDDWTPAGTSIFLSKRNGASTEYSYTFYVTPSGTLVLSWSADGATEVRSAVSTVATGITDGATKWVRATLDVDNGSSGNDVNFYLSDDGVTWTQLGTTRNAAGTTSIYSGTADVRIGVQYSTIASGPTAGKFYRAQICNGIDAVPVLDVDTSQITSGAATSFTALTGQTVTINRSTSGRKTVCVVYPLWLFGTDDYMEVLNRWIDGTTKCLYLPGLAGNWATAPDAAALDITGDIDIRCKVAMDDWTPTALSTLVGKYGASGQRSYLLYLNTTGTLGFQSTADGSTTITSTSTIAPTVADGATLWVRATLDVDNGASGNTVTFYTSTDGTNWTQLGDAIVNAGTTSIFNSTALLGVGAYATSGATSPTRGRFFRAQVLNGIGGTVAFDANFETSITGLTQTSFTESSTNAATVTIATSGTSYVSTPIVQSGYIYPTGLANLTPSSYSYLDFGASDSFTAVVIVRGWSTLPNNAIWLSKRISSTAIEGAGYNLRTGSSGQYNQAFVISDNTTRITADGPSTLTAGTLAAFTAVRDVSADTITAYNNTTAGTAVTDTTTSGLSPSVSNLRIGRLSGSASNYIDMEFVAAAIFRRALTSAEITTIYNYYSGRVGA